MFLDLTLIGLVTTLEPVPVVAFILLLAGERGMIKGLVFTLTWLASLVAVLALTVGLTGGKPLLPHSSPSTAAVAVKLAVGVGLIFVGERKRRRRRRRSGTHRPPAWMARLDTASSWTAAGISVIVQPMGLVAAGAAVVTEAHVSSLASYLLLVYFCVLSTASLLTMELWSAFAPDRAGRFLHRLRLWIERHQEPAIIVLSLLLGLWLVGKSIYQLVT
ncbi:GAP family protein [Streptacidiphilus pinicola]|uniref:GAP family protein n=1 Tax=Streptacidiphilus pinicola TaxID=2219663 RepID=A0A2X0JUH0_9ACTN|nr:GAP family protein [Streptacidiphilus pinicola]RAG80535.1 GAP family protein [Streptacidiphilus pinicola]